MLKIGLIKLRMFRPLPVKRLQDALGKAGKVVVIDRNLSVGLGGSLPMKFRRPCTPWISVLNFIRWSQVLEDVMSLLKMWKEF